MALLAACSLDEPPAQAMVELTEEESRGRDLFTLHCAACHALVPSTVIVGPSLAGIAGTAGTRVPQMDAFTYLQTSITRPDAFLVEGFPNSMPPDFAKRLTGEEFDAIVAYLLTLE
jgi:nitric oxide reductase subunit C